MQIRLPDSYFVVRLFHPRADIELIELDEWQVMSRESEGVATHCWMEQAELLGELDIYRQWIILSDIEALPAVEQAVLETGYLPVSLVDERHYRQGNTRDHGHGTLPKSEIPFYPLAVAYDKEVCPTSQEWQYAYKTWAKVPGVQDIPLTRAYNEFLDGATWK